MVSISGTAPTSKVVTENDLSAMEKSVASIGSTCARSTEGQKRIIPKGGNFSK